ncbi:hypothetical protein ABZY44_19120 [Streptomyces sp. NPDC006544]|uniref:hypothetical protein n=1 Tax=Streptomyces sp. NPDC006544 TaxID=3154583 RepID=UPI0033B7FBCE
MFEYEIAAARSNDLIRQADTYRLIREAKRTRRSLSRTQDPEGPVRVRVGATRTA